MTSARFADAAHDQDFLEGLLVRATTLDERLSSGFEPAAEQAFEASVAGRISAWKRASAGGDDVLFAQRLARDGWSVESAGAQLGAIQLSSRRDEPAWWADARWIYRALLESGDEFQVAPLTEPLPFEHLFRPILSFAHEAAFADGERTALTFAARASLGRDLLASICDLCGPALYEMFRAPSRHAQVPPGRSPSPEYRSFIADLRGGAIADLLFEKPVLLRLLTRLTRQWIDATCEFARRLEADICDLRAQLVGRDAGRVVAVRTGLSDRHNEGRSVFMLSFESGERLVYKPKDVRLDASWFALIQSLNALVPPVDLQAAKTLARAGYGWSEFVEHVPCSDSKAVARYFFRAGAWLAMFHVTAATDMHYENVIAAGEHPVPIDLEMLLQPGRVERLRPQREFAAANAAREEVLGSVLNVGLLPVLGAKTNRSKYVVGGLKGGAPTTRKARWSNVNTDEMTMQIGDVSGPPAHNLPRLDGQTVDAENYVDDIVKGFEVYANFILTQHDAFIEALVPFEGLPVRYVVRPTRFYALLIERLKQQRGMTDGGVWSAQADFVSRFANWDLDEDVAWPLTWSERQALVDLNVPYFSYQAVTGQLSGGGVTVSAPVEGGSHRALRQLRGLERGGLARQAKIVRLSLHAGASGDIRRGDTGAAAVSGTEIRQEIEAIARSLTRSAIWIDQSAAWIGLDWSPDADVCQLAPLGFDLYGGAPGISIFLAAHARVSGNETSRELALAGVSALRAALRQRNVGRVARGMGIGGGVGLGSVVYALVTLADLTQNKTLIEDATLAAASITHDLISADKRFDAVAGAAGAIFGLLRLYRVTKDAAVLQSAIDCGNHMVRHSMRLKASASLPAPMNGMSHGLSGHALALNRLAAVSGREEFAREALACVACENESYDPSRQNWPDRRAGASAWPCQWCHGAAGIGLARLSMKRDGGFPESAVLERDLWRAVGGARQAGLHRFDTLCCGALGSLEFLLSAAEALGDTGPADVARTQISAVVRAARSTGDYCWPRGDREVNLGLYRGLAGIGFGMLRTLDRTLPSVLTWD